MRGPMACFMKSVVFGATVLAAFALAAEGRAARKDLGLGLNLGGGGGGGLGVGTGGGLGVGTGGGVGIGSGIGVGVGGGGGGSGAGSGSGSGSGSYSGSGSGSGSGSSSAGSNAGSYAESGAGSNAGSGGAGSHAGSSAGSYAGSNAGNGGSGAGSYAGSEAGSYAGSGAGPHGGSGAGSYAGSRAATPPAIPTTTAARLPLPRRSARARAAAPMTAKGGASPSPGGAGAAANGRFFTVGLVTAWYSSNIGVLLLNKYLLSNYGFKYPIFLTMCHMSACALLSYAAIAWLRIVPMQLVRSRVQLAKISALSLVFCGSVVSGNVSLRYLPVSFNQAVGATTPFFTAVFAYIMTVKRESWITYLTLVPVVTGVVIASGSEPSFHLFGFIMCIGATAARALKTVLQGILLSSEGEKLNSMNLLLYMAPVAVILLLPATLFMEDNVVGVTIELAKKDFTIVWLLLFNSCLAYFVNLTNFLVTKHTSALTLQVLGNAKGAVAVVVSILIFKNPVSITGMLGYTLTVIGVILYSESKKRSKP